MHERLLGNQKQILELNKCKNEIEAWLGKGHIDVIKGVRQYDWSLVERGPP